MIIEDAMIFYRDLLPSTWNGETAPAGREEDRFFPPRRREG
jgi:hypothetical protein